MSNINMALMKGAIRSKKAAGLILPSKKVASSRPVGKILDLQYFKQIMGVVNLFKEEVTANLIDNLPEFKRLFKEETRIDNLKLDQTYGEVITINTELVDIGIERDVTKEVLRRRLEKTADEAERFHLNNFNGQINAVLGVNPIMSEPYLKAVIAGFVEENVSLIESIPKNSLKDVEGVVRRGVVAGDSTAKITERIRRRFIDDRNKAALIANDQIGKFLGSLDQFRQTEIGITHYFWDTVGDEKVRTRHIFLDGKRFSWKKPPISGTNNERLHPGFPIRCRCSARPDLTVFD